MPEQPDSAGVPAAPTALPLPTEPETQTETELGVIDPADAPGLVEDTVDPVVDTVSGLPLPLPDLGVVTEIVPEDPLPPANVPSATDPVQVPPLPGLPPLP